MLSKAVHAAAFAKLAPAMLDRPAFSLETGKLMLSRFLLGLQVPADGMGAQIRQVSIRITDLCNLRCHTCGQWGDNGYLRGQPIADLIRDEVSAERYIELLHDLVNHGHRPGLYLWGGEPMLYRGTAPLIEAAANYGLPVSIASNGTKIADSAEQLVKAPLYLAQISIDGGDASVHNASRPGINTSNDSFATVVNALEALKAQRRQRGSRLPILAGLCTINQRNADRLLDIYDTFADKVDVLVFYLAWWIDENAASRHSEDFMQRFGAMPDRHLGWIGSWQPTDYGALSQQLTTLCRRALRPKGAAVVVLPHLTKAQDLERYYTDHDATFGYNRCTSIYRAVEINANGDMSPCRDYHDYVVGNIKTHSITDLWNNDAYRRFRCSLDKEGLMPVCTRCCGLMGN